MLTENQLKERKTGIGGSDAAAVCGVSKYKTPLQVYLDKTSANIIQNNNPVFERGHDLEPFLFDLFTNKTKKNVQKRKDIIRNKQYPFMTANIDGFIPQEKAILEIKTANKFVKSEWGPSGTDKVPDDYFIQVQHYLNVCDYKKAYVAVLFAQEETFTLLRELIKKIGIEDTINFSLTLDFCIYEIEKSETISNKLIKIEKEFWEKNILGKIPPDNQNLNDIKLCFPESTPELSIKATDKIIETIDNLKNLKNEKKEFNKQIDEKIKNNEFEILNFAKNSHLVQLSTSEIILKIANMPHTHFDSISLKNDLPDLYQSYLRTNTFRKFKFLGE